MTSVKTDSVEEANEVINKVNEVVDELMKWWVK